jgi:hypothetical protein
MPIAEAKQPGARKPKPPTLVKSKTLDGATVTSSAKSKAKQVPLTGMEDMHDSEIVMAAETYRDIRDERMALQKDEKAAKAKLLEVMVSKGRQTYRLETNEVVGVTKEEKVNVTVRKEKTASKDE